MNGLTQTNNNFTPNINTGFIQCSQIKFEETLTKDQSKSFNKKVLFCFEKKIIKQKILNIIIGSINFFFIIISLITLISKNKYYILFKTELILSYGGISDLINNALTSGINESSLSADNLKMPAFTKFWCDFGKTELGVLISYLIFLILFMAYEVISFLVHKNIIHLKIDGILYHIIVGLNLFFYLIFYIYIPLVFYLFLYSILVTTISPLNVNRDNDVPRTKTFCEEEWDEHKAVPLVNAFLIKLILLVSTTFQILFKNEIILYLSMKYYEDENISKEKIKSKKIYKNDQTLNIKIKANQMLYIKKQDTNDIIKFKQIKIDGLNINNINMNDFIYIKLDNAAIIDILSLTDWEYPDLNEIFKKLGNISEYIYGILSIFIALFKMHISKEQTYAYMVSMYKNNIQIYEEKPKYYDVFILYGSFEKVSTEIRFSFYIITLFIILLLLLKRIYFGGFSKYIFSLISFIASFVFLLENIIFIILTFILIIITIISLMSYNDIFKDSKEDMIQAKLYVQLFMNMIIEGLIGKLFYDNIKLIKILNIIRTELYDFYNNIKNNNNEGIKEEFQFKGLEENEKQYYLSEIYIEGQPNFLFYNIYDDIKKIPKSPGIYKINNSTNDKKDENEQKDIEQNNNTMLINNDNNENNINNRNINNNQNNDIIIHKKEANIKEENPKIDKKKERRNSRSNSNRKDKDNTKDNSKDNGKDNGKKTVELDEEKIENDNKTLKSENLKLKIEKEQLLNQLSNIIKQYKK